MAAAAAAAAAVGQREEIAEVDNCRGEDGGNEGARERGVRGKGGGDGSEGGVVCVGGGGGGSHHHRFTRRIGTGRRSIRAQGKHFPAQIRPFPARAPGRKSGRDISGSIAMRRLRVRLLRAMRECGAAPLPPSKIETPKKREARNAHQRTLLGTHARTRTRSRTQHARAHTHAHNKNARARAKDYAVREAAVPSRALGGRGGRAAGARRTGKSGRRRRFTRPVGVPPEAVDQPADRRERVTGPGLRRRPARAGVDGL